jgi:hypothetical protein
MLARHSDRFGYASSSPTVRAAICTTVCASIGSAVGAAIRPPVGSAVGAAIRPHVGATVRAAIGPSIRTTVGPATPDTESSGIGTTIRATIPDTGDALGTPVSGPLQAGDTLVWILR